MTDHVVLSFDSETCLITDLDKAPPLVCTSWASRDATIGAGLAKWDDPTLLDRMVSWLEGPYIMTGANIAYDFGVAIRRWPALIPLVFEAYENDRVRDVQVSTKLVDNAEGIMHKHPVFVIGANGKPSNYALAALSKRFRGVELDKTTYRLNYGDLMHVPLDEWDPGARKYACDDAWAGLEVDEALQLGYPELLGDQCRQARHAFWLHLVSVHGIRTDPEKVRALEAKLRSDYDNMVQRLIDNGLVWPKQKKNPKTKQYEWSRNTKAAKARMVEVMHGFENCKKTDGDDVSLGKEACADCGDDLLEDYAGFTSLQKRLGTEIKALKLGEIHCRFDSFKANGRTGSGEPTNLQNLPRSGGERECYVPREGFLFADADFDMLELRTWAQACLETVGQSTLADELNGGIDVHLSTGGEILGGLSYEEMKARKKEEAVKNARQTAKPVNFMLPAGGGAPRLVDAAKKDYGIILPADPEKDWVEKRERVNGEWVVVSRYPKPGVEYARQLIAAWKRKRPEAQPYFDMVSQMVRDADGRAVLKALFVDRYHGGLGFCDLANFHFSCLANDVAKDAGWAVTRECWDWTRNSVLYGSRIVNFPHDQIIAEVPIPVAHECAKRIGELMTSEKIRQRWLPDVPPTTTPCLATCFSKMAEAYYDCDMAPGCKHEKCRLIPWSLEGQVAKVLAEALNHVSKLWEKERKAA